MKKDYLITIGEASREGLTHLEYIFVVRAKNAMAAEKISIDVCVKKEEESKKKWTLYDIKRI